MHFWLRLLSAISSFLANKNVKLMLYCSRTAPSLNFPWVLYKSGWACRSLLSGILQDVVKILQHKLCFLLPWCLWYSRWTRVSIIWLASKHSLMIPYLSYFSNWTKSTSFVFGQQHSPHLAVVHSKSLTTHLKPRLASLLTVIGAGNQPTS